MKTTDYYLEQTFEHNEPWPYCKHQIDTLLGMNVGYRTYYSKNEPKRRVYLFHRYTKEQCDTLENLGFKLVENELDYRNWLEGGKFEKSN